MIKQAQIQGLDKVVERLQKLKQSSINDGNLDIVVGYAASHATYVHEINKNYNYGKQWKYLETPFKMLQGYFAKVIIQSYTRTGSIRVGLKKSAKALYAESQALVPIDTGELKASGFI